MSKGSGNYYFYAMRKDCWSQTRQGSGTRSGLADKNLNSTGKMMPLSSNLMDKVERFSKPKSL